MSEEGTQPLDAGQPPVDAPTPSFTVDVEAFKAAAPEGYDVEAAANVININKGDLFNIAKQNVELQKSFSSRMPVPDANDPEKMGEIYNRLGRPEDASGYQFGEEIKFTDDAAKSFIASKLHETGLNNDQANKLLEFQMQLNAQAQAEWGQQVQDGLALTDKQIQDWSGGIKGSKAFNDWSNVADAALKHFGVDKSDPDTEAFLSTDNGRAVLKLAYDFGTSSQNGKMLNIPTSTDTVGSLSARKSELVKEMVKLGDQWNNHPEKQAELNSIRQQIAQMSR